MQLVKHSSTCIASILNNIYMYSHTEDMHIHGNMNTSNYCNLLWSSNLEGLRSSFMLPHFSHQFVCSSLIMQMCECLTRNVGRNDQSTADVGNSNLFPQWLMCCSEHHRHHGGEKAANRWQQHLQHPLSLSPRGSQTPLQRERESANRGPNKSSAETIGTNYVQFYCTLISSMNVLIGRYFSVWMARLW